jgi:hypothetical protein
LISGDSCEIVFLQLEQSGEFAGGTGTIFGFGLGIFCVEEEGGCFGRIAGIGGISYVLGIDGITFLNRGISNIF